MSEEQEVKDVSKEIPQEGDFKMKRKPGRPKKLVNKKEETTKVDLNKKEDDAVQKQSTEKVDVDAKSSDGGKMGEAHVESSKPAKQLPGERKQIERKNTKTIRTTLFMHLGIRLQG